MRMTVIPNQIMLIKTEKTHIINNKYVHIPPTIAIDNKTLKLIQLNVIKIKIINRQWLKMSIQY